MKSYLLVIDVLPLDGQHHKIMNFKLEDFDMVKTIGTGRIEIKQLMTSFLAKPAKSTLFS